MKKFEELYKKIIKLLYIIIAIATIAQTLKATGLAWDDNLAEVRGNKDPEDRGQCPPELADAHRGQLPLSQQLPQLQPRGRRATGD